MHQLSLVLKSLLLLIACALQAPAQATYEVINVPAPGTITGKVKWAGERPKRIVIPITKNNDVCDPESAKMRDMERLLIDTEGGIENTVVYLKDISKGKAMDLPAARRELDQRRCRYAPHIVLVPQNEDMKMMSSDPVLHTIHMAGAASFNIPFPFQNRVVARTMRQNGVIDLKCNAGHVWMNAVALVLPHPYYAVTDEHGNFKLTDVPPGTYEIEAWHEGWHIEREETTLDVGTQKPTRRLFFTEPRTWRKTVTVAPNGTAKVSFEISNGS